jgi:hypothetical protein
MSTDYQHYSTVNHRSYRSLAAKHNTKPETAAANNSRNPVLGYGRWLPGQTGYAAGRGMTNRQRISEKLLADLAGVWEEHSVSVLQRLAVTDPGKLAQIAYGLLPRDVFISVEQRTPGNLDPDEWAILRRVIDLIQVNAKGAELGPVLETIENALMPN